MLGAALVAILAVAGSAVYSQSPVNSLPNPYKSIADWSKLGRPWGSTAGVDIDRDGTSVWVAERCGAFAPPSAMKPGQPFACDGSNLDPILKFDASGKLVKIFGAGLFVFPHGLSRRPRRQRLGDRRPRPGRQRPSGLQVQPRRQGADDARQAGVAGSGPDEFNAPSAVLVAPNGDIFVADGHGGNTNARIVKFDKTGKFIKAWGKNGTGPGEFDMPHALAIDSNGRLFVGDRNNNRIQIFDQDGKFLDQWSQFSRPSGIFIDKNDIIYVADSESGSVSISARRLEARHPHRQRQRRRGDSLHPRPRRARHHARAPRKASRSTPPATSTAPRSGRSG